MKKLLLALALLAGLSAAAQAPIPNGDLETWTGTALQRRPTGWQTTSDLLAAIGFPVPVNNVTRVTPGHGGTYAAQLATVNNALAGTVPAYLFLGTALNLNASGAALPGGIAYTTRPARLEFWYKLTGPAAATDSAAVVVQLTRTVGGVASIIADTSFIFSAAAPAYTLASLPLRYRSAATPDTLRLVFTSGSGANPTVGTTLTIDDVAMTTPTNPNAPTITAIAPASGAVGTSVTVTGTNFAAGSTVTLNGVAVPGATVGAGGTTLTFVVPTGATAGAVVVTTPAGSVTGATPFCVQYTATAPAVSRCGPGTVTLTPAGAPAGGRYAYYAAATGGTVLGAGATFVTPSLNTTTTFYVAVGTGTAPTGCIGPRTAVVATVNAALPVAVQASGPTTFCQGGSVTLTASGASTYVWSSGQTTPSITVSTTGTYRVTGTAAAGCSATSPATAVTVNPTPATPTLTQTSPGTLTSSSPTGNQFYLNGTAVTGAVGASYTVPGPAGNGSYTVVVTTNGCASAASAAQTVTLLATTNAALAQAMHLLPNPAHQACVVQLPALPDASTATLTLFNVIGQPVRRLALPLPATGTRAELNLQSLPPGVYLVQVLAGAHRLTKRLVVE